MRRLIPTLTLLMLLALTALPALAQEIEEAAPTYNGVGWFLVVFVALPSIVFVGFMMARRESSSNEDDLV
jgi:hypothetical protein